MHGWSGLNVIVKLWCVFRTRLSSIAYRLPRHELRLFHLALDAAHVCVEKLPGLEPTVVHFFF